MNQIVIIGALELGGIFAIMSLGLYISYKVLNLPDLTVDGSFTLGCAVSAVLTLSGHPFLGLLLAFVSGMMAGLITGLLTTKLKIASLLAGILTMTGLYSINLKIMNDSPNISLFDCSTIFTSFSFFKDYTQLILIVIFVFIIFLCLNYFLKTQFGLALRACGDNEDMVKASSIDADLMKIIGLTLANGLVALSGAIYAQHQSFADSQSGTGMMVIGLASIIIGMAFIKKDQIFYQLLAVILGAVIYRGILTIALQIGVPSTDLKLLSALLVVVALIFTKLKKGRVK
ncbi:ABC transporter permease [Allocoprobacillus halotolerans]|uniref:ABC transporter permease n=1 Tax=Allocoprobacillus halotolerans TaxID=2944914 RepID=A0ABY5I161_9FIRM|nr:ABC transporter permease [Allocoprobacillus halotolerans]UTY38680.1 ABC transporter permease [Allocoprobacillus halotolerans]